MSKTKTKLYEIEYLRDLKDLLKKSVEKYPNNVAFTYKNSNEGNNPEYVEKTYKEYDQDITALGTMFFKLGLQEEKIVVISPNRYEWSVTYFAITTGNMVVVPLDRSLPDGEIEGLVKRSQAKCVVFDKKYLEVFKKVKKENLSDLKYYICMDFEEEQDGILSYKEMVKKGNELVKQGDSRHKDIKIDNKKMSMMLFTSGTTAMSKAVMLSHFNLCESVNAIRSVIKVYETDVFLSVLPLHHTFESIAFLFVLASGAKIAYCDGLKYIAKNLEEYKVTAIVCVPLLLETMYKKIQKGIKDQGKDKLIKIMTTITKFLLIFGIDIRRRVFKSVIDKMGGHLRLVVSGAAAIGTETINGFSNLGINLIQGYGLTETSPVVCVENDEYKRAGSIGFPLPNLKVKIDNPDENGIGELITKGPSVMLGYYQNEEANKEVFKNGWFKTGDLGYVDKDGYVFISGRAKTVIVLKNGKNIFPEEVEMLVNNIEYISESMVYGKESEDGDIKLGIKIVYKEDVIKDMFNTTDESDIYDIIHEEIKKINKTMPPYKYIRDIIITKEPLIKTTTQKIKRHEEMNKIIV